MVAVGRTFQNVFCSYVCVFHRPREVENSGCCSIMIQPFPYIKIIQTGLQWRKACLENWRGEEQLGVAVQ